MAQNVNISVSIPHKIDVLNPTQSLDARYGVYDSEEEALEFMADYGLDGRQVAVYTDKNNGKVQLYLYNKVLHQLEPISGGEVEWGDIGGDQSDVNISGFINDAEFTPNAIPLAGNGFETNPITGNLCSNKSMFFNAINQGENAILGIYNEDPSYLFSGGYFAIIRRSNGGFTFLNSFIDSNQNITAHFHLGWYALSNLSQQSIDEAGVEADTAMGNQALRFLETGYGNVGLGALAARNVEESIGSTFIGKSAGTEIVSVDRVTIIGNFRGDDTYNYDQEIIISNGRDTSDPTVGIGFRVKMDGTTTVPKQTISTYNADGTGKVVVTKEILEDALEDYIQEPTTDGTSGQVLTTDGSGGRSWTTVNTDTPNLQDVTDKGYYTSNPINIGGTEVSPNLELGEDGTITASSQVEGQVISVATSDYRGKIYSTNITEDRNYELPDKHGIIALLDDIITDAVDIDYNNTTSGLNAENAQDAFDEIAGKMTLQGVLDNNNVADGVGMILTDGSSTAQYGAEYVGMNVGSTAIVMSKSEEGFLYSSLSGRVHLGDRDGVVGLNFETLSAKVNIIPPTSFGNSTHTLQDKSGTIAHTDDIVTDAVDIDYNNTASGLTATNAQELGDELENKKLDKVETGSTERVYAVNEFNNQSMIPTMEQFISDVDIIIALEAINTDIATISVPGKTMYKGQMYVSDSPAYIYLAYDDNQIIRK